MEFSSLVKKMLWLCAIACLLPFAYYLIRFGNYNFTKNPLELGPFGDFIGGILNPIVSLANLIVLIVITHLVSGLDKSNNEHSISAQKKIFMAQMSIDSYKNLADKLDSFPHNLVTHTQSHDGKYPRYEVLNTRHMLISFVRNNDHLFQRLEESSEAKQLRKTLGLILTSIDGANKAHDEKNQLAIENSHEVMSNAMEQFNNHKFAFFKLLQKHIIDHMN